MKKAQFIIALFFLTCEEIKIIMIRSKRFISLVVIIAILLLIPFIAMQLTNEVNWDLTDFVIMGIILFGLGITYEIISVKSKKVHYRIALGIGLLGAFLLFWVNGAVGIIGSENQPANLLYGAVFIVGILGSLMARFKAESMFLTMVAVTITQLIVPLFALIIWPPSEISWSPSVIGVFFLNAFFAFLFACSAVLFKRASQTMRHTNSA